MNDDTLRPEVREALKCMYEVSSELDCANIERVIRDELHRLTAEVAFEERRVNDCMDAIHEQDEENAAMENRAETAEAKIAGWERRWSEATLGRVVASGDDESGQPRVTVHCTRDALSDGAPIIFRYVRIMIDEPTGGE